MDKRTRTHWDERAQVGTNVHKWNARKHAQTQFTCSQIMQPQADAWTKRGGMWINRRVHRWADADAIICACSLPQTQICVQFVRE